jgi:hypothetical protein
MYSQIFRKPVPKDIIWNLLDKICTENKDHFLLSPVSLRCGKFHNLIDDFYSILMDYYHISKQHYLTREINYSKFTTIIRQLCKVNGVSFTSKIVYNKSNYEILYYIYK